MSRLQHHRPPDLELAQHRLVPCKRHAVQGNPEIASGHTTIWFSPSRSTTISAVGRVAVDLCQFEMSPPAAERAAGTTIPAHRGDCLNLPGAKTLRQPTGVAPSDREPTCGALVGIRVVRLARIARDQGPVQTVYP